MLTRKHIRAKILARHRPISCELNSGPVLRVQEDLFRDPEGDGLLRDGLQTKSAELGGESLLGSASSSDRLEKRGNVVFIAGFLRHRAESTTRNLVGVNK